VIDLGCFYARSLHPGVSSRFQHFPGRSDAVAAQSRVVPAAQPGRAVTLETWRAIFLLDRATSTIEVLRVDDCRDAYYAAAHHLPRNAPLVAAANAL